MTKKNWFSKNNFLLAFLILFSIFLNEAFAQESEVVVAEDTNQENEFVQEKNTSYEETVFRDSSKNLRLFKYDTEIFSAENSLGGKRVLSSSDGNRIVRKFFDASMRLEKIEEWQKGDTFEKIASEDFFYRDDSIMPYSSTRHAGNSFTETTYDNSGHVTLVKNFKIKSEEGKSDIRILDTSERWRYSSEGNLLESVYEKMNESGKKIAFSKREVFTYKKKSPDAPPDYEVYEDGKLRERKIFADEDSYELTLFFDGDYSVKEVYKDGKKISDVIVQNGRTIREHEYGN